MRRTGFTRILATGAASTLVVGGATLTSIGAASAAAPTATTAATTHHNPQPCRWVPQQTITLQLPLLGKFVITIPAHWQCPH
ncbi:hypothetical protein OG607_08405 [Streptomyces sp. NBC_01537]|uniref:hypothetical protein n=1 Tax=Streptomyces sp. NBC_01537 TaxID=2903896 RepID=UPI00386B512D